MKVETVKCDVCGRVKGEANKWLIVYVNRQLPVICIASTLELLPSYEGGHEEDICSDACLQKRLGELLTLIRGES